MKIGRALVIVAVVGAIGASGWWCIKGNEDYKEYEQLREEVDTMERDLAIRWLESLEGRFAEISYLSTEGVSQEILRDRIEDLVSVRILTNVYADIELNIPSDTSDVETICENLIEQIESYINEIEIWGDKGE